MREWTWRAAFSTIARDGWPRARIQLQAALATDNAFGLDAAAFDANVDLARVETAAGKPLRALSDLDAGLKLSEVLRVQVSDPELRGHVHAALAARL